MAQRRFIFRGGNDELVLPVTPASYEVEKGIRVETVNISEIGDAIFAGHGTLATMRLDFILPANRYAFSSADDPMPYLERLESWIEQKMRLRWISGGTGVNLPVIIERLTYGENDGTNDLYCSLTLREHRSLEQVKVSGEPAASKAREEPEAPLAPAVENYKIVYGDTLSAICRANYGDGSAAVYNRLAAFNNIPNPNLIYAGAFLKIPQPLP
jgi:hypothetical protein